MTITSWRVLYRCVLLCWIQFQIAEYTQWSHDAIPKQKDRKRDADSIAQYFQKEDVVVEKVQLKSKKRKLTEKEREERDAAYALNVEMGAGTDG